MIVRACVFLALVLILATAAFRYLIEDEVKRVLSVHVIDKASHLVDMLEGQQQRVTETPSVSFDPMHFQETAAMAHDIHVATLYWFDLNGRELSRLNTEDALRTDQSTAPISEEHGSNPAPLGAHSDHSANHGDSTQGQHGGGANYDPQKLVLLSNVPVPDVTALRPLVERRSNRFISVQSMRNGEGATINYAQVVLPVASSSGEQVGFVGFILDVTGIYSIYAKGVMRFGLLFMACGLVLFGVPAFAFWLQKRLAERSTSDARYLSHHDALTGLLNRSAFTSEAQCWLDEDRIGHAAYIDADRFKLINDTYGHSVGDAFLCHIASLLKANCGPDALVARLGGDEFTFILPKEHAVETQSMIATLMRLTAQEVQIDGYAITSSVSIGITEPKENETLEELLQRADTALYFAKSDGRNTAAFYTDEMGAAARRRRLLESRLRDACRNEEFELAYQPLVDAKSDVTLGYEALLRLNETNGNPIPPSEFVPLAEEIGLIEEIGTWVLHAATKEISELDDHSSVSVNLSAEQFKSGNLVSFVIKALELSDLPPHRLELEITESILLQDDTRTKFQIDTLKEMGISIAMDDFGTGFSSLSTLWKYGFDRIKIDKSFVQALDETPEKSRQLIDSIVLLAKRMDMSITAEGIESDDQRDILVELGCNVLQGFYFGKPKPIVLPRDGVMASRKKMR